MPKRRDIMKAGLPKPRIREASTLMRTHETMVDFIKAAGDPLTHLHSADSFLNVLTSGLFDFRSCDLEQDLIYSDEEEEEEEEEEDPFCARAAAHTSIEAHPRIREITEEELLTLQQQINAEQRKKEKNRRKKMRKKQKRTGKENESLHEEEEGQEELTPTIPDNPELAEENEREEKVEEREEKEEEKEERKEVEEKTGEREEEERQEETGEKEEKTEEREEEEREKEEEKTEEEDRVEERKEEMKEERVQEKPAAEEEKEEEENKDNNDETADSTVKEFAKRSRELAATGNRLAAAGQFQSAVQFFTDAIKFNPTEFRLFGNRSLCFERLRQFENALRDAELALSMEPQWMKGLFRKGKALSGLKRYLEASLVYREVLTLDGSSSEAAQELKRAQTLHLMDLGFSWSQSTEALKSHPTLEEAVEALLSGPGPPGTKGGAVSRQEVDRAAEQDAEWRLPQTDRLRPQQVKESEAPYQTRTKSQSPTRFQKNPGRRDQQFSVWVGSLSETVTHRALHELFSRVGVVTGIKVILEHHCAFVHYSTPEDCDTAVHAFDGMVFEGTPLSVNFTSRTRAGSSSSERLECFFWRTSGCTRDVCSYRHVPENLHMDKNKFSGLGHK